VVAGIRAVAASLIDHRDELTRLDREIGDADHGENLARGFRAVLATLDADPAGPGSPPELLTLVAGTLISTVGGASGPLLGTAYLRAAGALAGHQTLDGPAVAAALRAALDGVLARGRAAVGDKTMVDALSPAADAAARAAGEGGGPAEVLAAAANAAAAGVQTTYPLVARKGRASYLGQRSAGHIDPGAESTALAIKALAVTAEAAAGARR
jgi:dihydroxyacetone kinase-like protein